jgi:hypothetical protein
MMISFKKIILLIFLLGIKVAVYSQCAMCKAVVESDLAAGGTAGKGINEGILYLMVIPYLLMGTVGYFI